MTRRSSSNPLWHRLVGLGALTAAGALWWGGLRRPRSVSAAPPGTTAPQPLEIDLQEGWISGPAGDLFLRSTQPTVERSSPVLLLHGLAGSSDHWRSTLATFGSERALAALDLRGHGRSDTGAITASELVADLTAVLDALGWSRCRLLGHELGAVAALEFRHRQPHRVLGSLLLDPPLGIDLGIPGTELSEAVAREPRTELELQFQPLLTSAPPEVRTAVLRDLERAAGRSLVTGFDTLLGYTPTLEPRGGPLEIWLTGDAPTLPKGSPWQGQPHHRFQRAGHWWMLEPDTPRSSFRRELADWL